MRGQFCTVVSGRKDSIFEEEQDWVERWGVIRVVPTALLVLNVETCSWLLSVSGVQAYFLFLLSLAGSLKGSRLRRSQDLSLV